MDDVLDIAGVMTFTKHNRFLHLNRDPHVEYNCCSILQVIAADKTA